VKKHIQDAVPKAIMHFLVNHSKQSIQSELVKTLYKEDLFDQLLQESDSTLSQRSNVQKQLTTLRKALRILDDFQFNI
jgi:dynamin 1-like protein